LQGEFYVGYWQGTVEKIMRSSGQSALRKSCYPSRQITTHYYPPTTSIYDLRFTIYKLSVFNSVEFDLEVKRGRLDVQESGRGGLVSPSALQRELYETNLKASHFIVKVDAFGDVQRAQLI
jgi:hypothetical protein